MYTLKKANLSASRRRGYVRDFPEDEVSGDDFAAVADGAAEYLRGETLSDRDIDWS